MMDPGVALAEAAGANFAILLLDVLEPRIADLRHAFELEARRLGRRGSSGGAQAAAASSGDAAALPRAAFVEVLAQHVQDACTAPHRNNLLPSALCRTMVDLATAVAPAPTLARRIGEVFDTVAATAARRGGLPPDSDDVAQRVVSFSAFVHFAMACRLRGARGQPTLHAWEPLRPLPHLQFQRLDDTTRASYAPALNAVVTSGAIAGIVDPLRVTAQSFVCRGVALPAAVEARRDSASADTGAAASTSALVSSSSSPPRVPESDAERAARRLEQLSGWARDRDTTIAHAVAADHVAALDAVAVIGGDHALHLIDRQHGTEIFSAPLPEEFTTCRYEPDAGVLLVGTASRRVAAIALGAMATGGGVRRIKVAWTGAHTHFGAINRLALAPYNKCSDDATNNNGAVLAASADGTVSAHTLKGALISVIRISRNDPIECVIPLPPLDVLVATSATTVYVVSNWTNSKSATCVALATPTPHTVRVLDATAAPDQSLNGGGVFATLDQRGDVRIWDAKRAVCLQALAMPPAPSVLHEPRRLVGWHSLVWLPPSDAAAASGEVTPVGALCAFGQRRVQLFTHPHDATALFEHQVSTSTPTRHSLGAADPTRCATLHPLNPVVATVSDKTLRLWDGMTGRLESELTQLATSSVETAMTAACLSDDGELLVLAFRSGRLSVHSASTGAVIVVLVNDNEGPEVTTLVPLWGTHSFLALSWDRCQIYVRDAPRLGDAPDAFSATCFTPDPLHGVEPRCAHWDRAFQLLTFGYRHGAVTLYSAPNGQRLVPEKLRRVYATGSVEGVGEVEAVAFLSGYPAIAAVDVAGRVHLITAPPHAHPGRRIAVYDPTLLNDGPAHIITAVHWYAPRRILYCVDDGGGLCGIGCSDALASAGIYDPAPDWAALMADAGGGAVPPDPPMPLHLLHRVVAHSSAPLGVIGLPGLGTLFTTSAHGDLRAWTLGLRPRGRCDAQALQGTFHVPFARVDATDGRAYLTQPDADDDTETMPRALGNPTIIAAVGAALETQRSELAILRFMKEPLDKNALVENGAWRPPTRVHAGNLAASGHLSRNLLLGRDTASKVHAESFVVAPTDALQPSRAILDRITATAHRDGASANAQTADGPDAINILSHSPGQAPTKRFVVDTCAPGAAGPRDPRSGAFAAVPGASLGEAYMVTQDMPVPPRAKEERNFALRHLHDMQVQRAEAELRRAASQYAGAADAASLPLALLWAPKDRRMRQATNTTSHGLPRTKTSDLSLWKPTVSSPPPGAPYDAETIDWTNDRLPRSAATETATTRLPRISKANISAPLNNSGVVASHDRSDAPSSMDGFLCAPTLRLTGVGRHPRRFLTPEPITGTQLAAAVDAASDGAAGARLRAASALAFAPRGNNSGPLSPIPAGDASFALSVGNATRFSTVAAVASPGRSILGDTSATSVHRQPQPVRQRVPLFGANNGPAGAKAVVQLRDEREVTGTAPAQSVAVGAPTAAYATLGALGIRSIVPAAAAVRVQST